MKAVWVSHGKGGVVRLDGQVRAAVRTEQRRGSKDRGAVKIVRRTLLVSKKGVAAARRRLEPGKRVSGHVRAVRVYVQLCRGHARRSVLYSAAGAKQTIKAGAWPNNRGARFGTAAVGEGVNYYFRVMTSVGLATS